MTAENSCETLVQNQPLNKSNRITFIDNRTLRIDTQENKRSSSYRIDVIALKNKHSRQLTFAWKWLAMALILFTVLLVESSYSLIFPGTGSWLSILGQSLMGLLSVACLVYFIKLSHGKYVFNSRHARVPLLEVWSRSPSGKSAKNFLKLIEKRIENAHQHMNLSEEQQLTGEMKMLRRLKDENILKDSAYEAARARLMKKF